MVKHLIKQTSKSILFPEQDIKALEQLAQELGYTRHQGGVETADVSKLVRRAVRFMIDNPDAFKTWQVKGVKKANTKN